MDNPSLTNLFVYLHATNPRSLLHYLANASNNGLLIPSDMRQKYVGSTIAIIIASSLCNIDVTEISQAFFPVGHTISSRCERDVVPFFTLQLPHWLIGVAILVDQFTQSIVNVQGITLDNRHSFKKITVDKCHQLHFTSPYAKLFLNDSLEAKNPGFTLKCLFNVLQNFQTGGREQCADVTRK